MSAATLVLDTQMRHDVGKGASRRLRRADLVPAIIYGGEQAPVQIAIASKAIRKAMASESFYSQVMTLRVAGNEQAVILKAIQRHPAKEFAMHLDFLRVDATQAITTHVPLHFLNEDTCKGVKLQGGAITHARVEVEVRCLPGDLPEFIAVDMANVELGKHVHLSDITVPDGVELVALAHNDGHNLDVASVQTTRAMKNDDEAATPAAESEAADSDAEKK